MKLTIINQNQEQLVSARELYTFLEVKRDFTTWIKHRIIRYQFEENQDFQLFNLAPQIGGASHGGHNKIDYILTLDTAKELCMIENNEKGREARKYFIACEKEYIKSLKNKTSPPNLSELDYEDSMIYIKGLLNNLKSRLIFEKTEIEEKLKKLENTGLTDEIRAYVFDGKIQIIQDL